MARRSFMTLFFNRRPNLDALAQKLLAATMHVPRGEIVTHEMIEDATGIDRNHRSWKSVREKWELLMEEKRETCIWPVHGVGFKLLTEEESQYFIARKRARKRLSQYHKQIRQQSCASDETLGEFLAGSRVELLSRLEVGVKRDEEDVKISRMLARKPQTLPR